MMKNEKYTMIYDQDLREKMEWFIKLLLLFSIIVFNMMKLLASDELLNQTIGSNLKVQ